MKVILFDIDHTIMASPPGANKRSSQKMFIEKFGIDVTEDSVEKVGMTEWGIMEKIAASYPNSKIPLDVIQQGVPEEVYQYWADELQKEMAVAPSTLLPGIFELITELSQEKDVKLGLLTGNSYWRSEVKLMSVGLDEFFRDRTGQLRGSFGNESRTREGLVSFAQDRLVFDHDSLSIIDDSLIGANMLHGKREIFAIFVATGSASAEQLQPYGRPVYQDLGEGRWKEALELFKKYA